LNGDYVSSLGDDLAFADCWLSPEEIASDPQAAAFAASFIAGTAASLGIDPAKIQVDGISTDGDTTPGCGPQDGPVDLSQTVSLRVDPEFIASLGTSAQLSDCYLSMEEIATDPEALAIAEQFIAATAAQFGVDVSQISVAGFSTDGDDTPGCATGGPQTAGSITIQVGEDFASSFGDDLAFADCWLSPEEIASDPQAAAFAATFIAGTAASLGIDPATIQVDGISTDGDATPGCGRPQTSSGLTLSLSPAFAASLGDDAAFADCWLSAEEIASDPEAAAFAAQFIATTAASLGVDAGLITLTGISTDGDQTIGCAQPAQTGSKGTLGLTVAGDFAATLASDAAFADCWLTADEIAGDPEAAAFAAAFIQV
jgi:poly(3-hydroxybutyrate) depolymerase